jgi:hypothetical protein
MEVVKMKKSKKFLSILLAAAMTFSMAAMPVFADDNDDTTSGFEVGESTDGELDNDDNKGGGDAGGSDNTETNKITPITTLSFQKVLEVDDALVIPDANFTFHMVPTTQSSGAEKNGYKYYTGVELANPEVTLYVEADDDGNYDTTTVVNDVKEMGQGKTYVAGYSKDNVKGIVLNGTFDLTPAAGKSFDKVGIYSYEVYETQPDGTKTGTLDQTKTISTDTTHFTVDLYVDNDGNVYAAQSNVGDDKQPIVFENALKTASLIINKQVSGTGAVDADAEYTFWLKIPEGGDSIVLDGGLNIPCTKKTVDNTDYAEDATPTITVGGEKEADSITLAEAKTAWKTDADAKAAGWNKFTLKAGESLVFEGLPAGMIYYLFEEDGSHYKTYRLVKSADADSTLGTPGTDSFMLDSNGNKNITVNLSNGGKGTLAQHKNGVYFLNEINVSTETGVTVDVLPYVVVVLAVAAAFAVLLISKKRRNAR